MEIEELFCKRYPEYSVNGKPLHPYFDIFEEGYEQAEKENEELRNNGFTVSAMTEQQLKVALKKGERLEKENAELKADNDARKFAMAMSEKVEKQLREQIEKLKTDIDDAIDSASKWYEGDPVYSMLVDIYNDNFEITKGVSN